MPSFSYIAKKNLNESTEGIIVADTQDQAIDKLMEMGLAPVKVEILGEETVAAEAPVNSWKRLLPARLTVRELGVFTSQLKSLMKARVDLLKSLSILYGQSNNEKLKKIVLDIHAAVKNGATFSDALKARPDFFPNIYVNLIRSGEASGRLDEVLAELDSFLSRDQELKMHIRAALAYPALMVTVGVGVIFVLFSYVIPKLSAIFTDFDYTLPLPTQIMLGISAFFKSYWWAVLLAGAGMGIGLAQMSKSPQGRAQLDWVKLKIPVIASLIQKQALSRFCRTLALLIRSGLPVFQALDVATPTLENAVYMKEMEGVRKDVMEGGALAGSMRKISFFPPFLLQMIAVGEEGGRLEGVLNEVADIYVQETNTRLKVVTSLLEPVIILTLGLVLGAVVLAMLLPIFQINMLVK